MQLSEYQNIQSSGARCVELFEINGETYLALPQLSEDIAGDPPSMNGGNSDVDVLIFKWQNNKFIEYQLISSHGNEHVNFYKLGERYFLAVASIRSGKQPDFKMNIQSKVYEWKDGYFIEFQAIDTFAAKCCQFFNINDQHFLCFSEGVKEPGADNQGESYSHLYQWDGSQFEPFQSLPSTWGYEITFFEINNRYFLAIADNLESSTIYEWNGQQFTPFQQIAKEGGGRHFCYFQISGDHYIAFANLLHESVLYKWDGKAFIKIQVLEEAGARSFHVLEKNNKTYLFRTNFITGTREQPIAEMDSVIYQWNNKQFQQVLTYKTYGGTDARTFERAERTFLVVSNSLSKEIRFQTPTKVYEIMS